MANLITVEEPANRLARTIISDIKLYNEEKVRKGIEEDNLFEALASELKEGVEHYNSRVAPELRERTNFFNFAIMDVLLKSLSNIPSKMW